MSIARLIGYGAPLALDAGAAALVLDGRGLEAAVLHALAVALALAATVRWLPGHPAAKRAALSAAALVLALPVVGAAVLAFVAWPSWSRRPERAAPGVVEVALPDGSAEVDDAPEPARSRRPRPIRVLLRDAQSPDERVRAVMALRHMEARRAVPLLRLAFSHENEDVRLLAFGILEQREKRLRSRIEQNEARLELSHQSVGAASQRWHRRLARDHWELVYGGFVSGDLEPVVLGKARDHALASLARGPDARMAVLLARIYLRRRQPEAAQDYLDQAVRAGLPASSAAPLLAEAAFQMRRFGDIRGILRGVGRGELRRPELDPVAEYWTSEA